jgi:hypothetical protein
LTPSAPDVPDQSLVFDVVLCRNARRSRLALLATGGIMLLPLSELVPMATQCEAVNRMAVSTSCTSAPARFADIGTTGRVIELSFHLGCTTEGAT